jgi:hypothetical protein
MALLDERDWGSRYELTFSPAYWGTGAGPPVEIWALQSSRRLVGAKVRAFLDVVEKAFPAKVFVPPI